MQYMIAAVLLAVVPMFLFSTFALTRISAVMTDHSNRETDNILNGLRLSVVNSLESFKLDTLTIANYPPMAGLCRAEKNDGRDPIDFSTVDQWEARLTTLFYNYELLHPGTAQIRLLNAKGQERLRVDFSSNGPRKLAENELQDKSQRDYFKKASNMPPGTVAISPINLNQEHGKIQLDQPMVRFSTPVWIEGDFFGVVVLNVEPSRILSQLELAAPDGQLFLASMDGDYMYHDQRDKRWGLQLKTGANLFNDYPDLSEPAKLNKVIAGGGYVCRMDCQGEKHKLALTSISLGNADHWLLGIDTDMKLLMVEARAFKGVLLIACLAIAGLAAVVAAWFSRVFAGPIQHLADLANRVRGGDFTAKVETTRKDELGDLQCAFNGMIGELQNAVTARQDKAAAEAASDAKSQFLANMSHEIRTPMTAILGYSELLEDPEITEDVRNKHVVAIRRSGNHLMDIINDILDLSKVEADRLEIESVLCDPVVIVNEVMTVLMPKARSQHTELICKCNTAVPRKMESDPTRLRQIFFNLIGNAVKFTKEGVVTAELGLEPGDGHQMMLQIDVTDTGIGMNESAIETLFAPFSQADNSMTRQYGGTGLGLTISRRLAEVMGGGVQLIESTAGVGSKFRVRLPVTVEAGASVWPAGVIEPTTATSKKPEPQPVVKNDTPLDCDILLVEDGPDNQRLFNHLLTKAGARVTLAANGQEGLAAVLRKKRDGESFDLILSDMQMPVMDGYEATRRMRDAGIDTPIIALTANAMQEDRDKCLAAGCNDFLKKPIEKKALLETVGRYARPEVGAGI